MGPLDSIALLSTRELGLPLCMFSVSLEKVSRNVYIVLSAQLLTDRIAAERTKSLRQISVAYGFYTKELSTRSRNLCDFGKYRGG